MPSILSIPFPVLALLLIVPLAGALTAATPWLMGDRECFAVTVPAAASRDPRLVRMKRGYSAIMAVLAFASFVLCVASVALAGPDALAVAVPVATFAQIGIGFALMLRCRARVRAIKAAEGWTAAARESVSVSDAELPRPLPVRWELLHLAVIAASIALAWALYPSVPDKIVQHVGFDGVPTDYMDKSPVTALLPAIICAFMAAVMTVSHLAIVRSKRPVDPATPSASALAYALFARVQSVALCVSGLLINLVLGLGMPLAFANMVSVGATASVIIAVVLVIVAANLWVAVAYGQNGSRVLRDAMPSDELRADDDAHWLAGVFYVNREDPSAFVPKRFGVGWTVNLGSWRGISFIIGFLALTVLFVILIMCSAGA